MGFGVGQQHHNGGEVSLLGDISVPDISHSLTDTQELLREDCGYENSRSDK